MIVLPRQMCKLESFTDSLKLLQQVLHDYTQYEFETRAR